VDCEPTPGGVRPPSVHVASGKRRVSFPICPRTPPFFWTFVNGNPLSPLHPWTAVSAPSHFGAPGAPSTIFRSPGHYSLPIFLPQLFSPPISVQSCQSEGYNPPSHRLFGRDAQFQGGSSPQFPSFPQKPRPSLPSVLATRSNLSHEVWPSRPRDP